MSSRLPSDGEQVPTVVQSVALGAAESGVFVLTITEGPEKGRVITLEGSQPEILVGQGPACDVRLSDPEVSRRHIALSVNYGGVRLRDLGSTNGTYVDRVKVIECDLRGDELVRIGATVARVDYQSQAVNLPPEGTGFGRVIGASRAMRRLYPLCARLASANVPIIIEGETGTGKELLAESIHEESARAAGPFVVFDCTAVPPNLVESELFGHERGAFTGAVASRPGIFEQAHGGTLLIDEIGDLELTLQPKLLRAIERSEVRRIGGTQSTRVDVRLLAATRRDLDREVQAGRFRDDLFHRLAVTRIGLPPLRERRGDVALIARMIWAELQGDPLALTPAMLARWDEYPWPGNVRELRNAVTRQLALGELADSDVAQQRNSAGREGSSSHGAPQEDAVDRVLSLPFTQARDQLVEEFEQRYVARVLERHGGDVAKAAAASGIGRRYFQKLRSRNVVPSR